jgi:hypothetical protein
VGGEKWQEKVYNREEWKNLLRTARSSSILHVPMELMNVLASSWDLNPSVIEQIKVLS